MFTYTYLQGRIKRLTQAMNTGKYPTHLQPLFACFVLHTTWFSHFLVTGNRRTNESGYRVDMWWNTAQVQRSNRRVLLILEVSFRVVIRLCIKLLRWRNTPYRKKSIVAGKLLSIRSSLSVLSKVRHGRFKERRDLGEWGDGTERLRQTPQEVDGNAVRPHRYVNQSVIICAFFDRDH